MSTTVLPREAELRNWAARGLEAKGEVLLDNMSRLKAVVTRAAFPATAHIKCRKDEQYRYVVEVDAEMTVTLQCQRCLGDCEKKLTTSSTLCVLWTEDVVNELPVDYDPLIAGDVSNLHAIIEEELLLALPAVPMHEIGSCGQVPTVFGDLTGDVIVEKENPFAALKGLLKNTTSAADKE